MFSSSKIQIRDINSLITCYICHGYLIDAVSLPDCHHSFCQSCIMKHVLNKNTCPICGLLIHKTRPELYLIPDKTLQQIVYKLVPGLLKKEIISREEFGSSSKTNNNDADANKKLNLLDYSDNIAADDDTTLCLEIDLIKITKNENGKASASRHDRRYLFLSGMFPVRLLKKFASNKFELSDHYVEICHDHADLFLPDHFTLNDVAEIINWKAESPLALKCVVWEDDNWTDTEIFNAIGSIRSEPCESSGSSAADDSPALPECPYNSFKEYREHVKKANLHTKEVSCPSKGKNIKCKKKFALHERTNLPKSVMSKSSQPDHSYLPNTDHSSASHLYNTTQSNDHSASVSTHQHSCQLKLRIRAKGVADSVLILLPAQLSTADSTEDKRTVKHHHHKFSSFGEPDAESSDNGSFKSINNVFGNEAFPKKVMSKKSMFFSRLSHDQFFLNGFLKDHNIDDHHQDCSEEDRNNPFLSFLHTPQKESLLSSSSSSLPSSSSSVPTSSVASPLPSVSSSSSVLPSGSTVTGPLNVSIENRVSTSTPIPCFSDGANFKKRLLLTTTATTARRKGQIWKPYSSPEKNNVETEVLEKNRIDPSTSDRNSKSPVIVFNPSLPLPSFSSLLRSFGSSSSSSSAPDFHDSNSNGSKIGVFISKGKSMTLEEKTKITHDFNGGQNEEEKSKQLEIKKVADSFSNSTLQPDEILTTKQPAEPENTKSKFLLGCTGGGRSEAKVERKGLAFRKTNISNGNSRRKTPPWLGKKIEITKFKKDSASSKCSPSYKDNDDIRSPHKKKLQLDINVVDENPRKAGSGNDLSSSNRSNRRPLSIRN